MSGIVICGRTMTRGSDRLVLRLVSYNAENIVFAR